MIDFWKIGIRDNTGLKYHIVGGKLFGALAMAQGESYLFSLLFVLCIAIIWEFGEAISMLVRGWDLSLAGKKYGTTKNFLLDSLGDILGAIVGAL
jgi:hypothetical protein